MDRTEYIKALETALAALVKAATPICDAINDADAAGEPNININDVIEDAVHLGIAIENAEDITAEEATDGQ